MRDLKYWQAKYFDVYHKSVKLTWAIKALETNEKNPPKRRRKGEMTKFRYGKPRPYKAFCFRNRFRWERALFFHTLKMTRLGKLRRELKMLDTTKLPYYKERILALGGVPDPFTHPAMEEE